MNIYDFDNTIYEGDSSVDFFKFCLKRNKKVLLYIPSISLALILYLIKIKEKEYLKSKVFRIVRLFDNIDEIVKAFWKEHDKNIKEFYLKQKKESDIIISASPYFLLKPVSLKYGFKLIASNVDKKTGKFLDKNCYGEEKVKELNKIGINDCEKFYSDSLSDTPLSNIAKESFIVKGKELTKWEDYKVKGLKKIKKTFLNRDFITFIFIGFINAFNGVWIAYVYSLMIKNPIIAYVFGFLTSLCISYLLNSLLNFKVKLSINKFIKFAINNIPNFIIQVLSVVILIDLLDLPKLISFIVSAVIAVPITFVLVKLNVFKNQ